MKNKTNKILQYSAVALAASAILPIGCTKDKEQDDPNIIHRDLNKTYTITSSVIDSIDVNLDGINELRIVGSSNANATITYMIANPGNAVLYSDTTSVGSAKLTYASNDGFTPVAAPSSRWKIYNVLDVIAITPALDKGIAGKGDKFISFAFINGIKPFYGWMRVNVSADHKTVVFKDLAYSVLPETRIKTGSK